MARLSRMQWPICAAAFLAVLSTTARGERLPVKICTSAGGLGSSFIDYLMRDSRGFLWFCTRDGLNRFDGSRFVITRSASATRRRELNRSRKQKAAFIRSALRRESVPLYGRCRCAGPDRTGDPPARNGGVSRLGDTGATVLHFTNLSTVDGLNSNNLRSITEDKRG